MKASSTTPTTITQLNPPLTSRYSIASIIRQTCFHVIVTLLSMTTLLGCQKPTEVNTTLAKLDSIESVVTGVTSGTVKAEKSAELAFSAMGRVRELNVKVGDFVKQGDTLAQIENQDAKVAVDTAQAEFNRRVHLQQSGSVAAAESDEAKRLLDAAKIALTRTIITAPFNGMIAEVNMEVGQLSQTTAVVPLAPMRIVDLLPRYVRTEIDEVDLPRVKPGQTARVKILAVRRTPFQGTVRKVVPYVSTLKEQDRTVEVELTVDSSEILLPAGASADVEIITDFHQNVLTVPVRAVLARGYQRYLFVDKNGVAEERPVTTGLSNFEKIEILSGLVVNESVIIPGSANEIKAGDKVKSVANQDAVQAATTSPSGGVESKP
jgi:HlyD family secretion protein